MNMVVSFITLIGRVVRDVGSGIDSTSVSFSRGMLARREAGRSAGEQATMACRRCVLEV
jgi:hypothetical protein